MSTEDFFADEVDRSEAEVVGEGLRVELLNAMKHWARNRPRSLQTELGPSGAGTPCLRKLAYGLNAEVGPNEYGDPLPSMVGTAMHAQQELVMGLQNDQDEQAFKEAAAAQLNANSPEFAPRWLIETRVEKPIAGTCDLFDTKLKAVVDWKFLGPTTMGKYAPKGKPLDPSEDYKGQGQLYGLGMENRGFEVEWVGIFMVPRSGKLRDTKMWFVPYDREKALALAARAKLVKSMTKALDTKSNPYRYRLFPATPSDSSCFFCPWHSPGPADSNPFHCQGVSGKTDDDGNLIEEEE